tara:strand:+ start:745 stop:1017 length:273 start_codon:yes stop_codon:yes gene_type:complete
MLKQTNKKGNKMINKYIKKCSIVEGVHNESIILDELQVMNNICNCSLKLQATIKNKYNIINNNEIIQTGTIKELAFFISGLRSIIPVFKK